MARLEAQKKMGYYPTPEETLRHIRKKIRYSENVVVFDPCCGAGNAVFDVSYNDFPTFVYGVELDAERAAQASKSLERVLTGSIYDVVVRPLGCFSMLYLNPPYDYENGERMEYLFLKHAERWLMPGGLLVYLVPESVMYIGKLRNLIARKFTRVSVYRFTRNDYPLFKQVVLMGIKQHDNESLEFVLGDLPHIEDTPADSLYQVPGGEIPSVFDLKGIRPDEIVQLRHQALRNVRDTVAAEQQEKTILSPIFPLRKGHMVSLLMSGTLNGRLKSNGKDLIFKCFTDRQRIEREEDGKCITTDTYRSGIRVIEDGRWYDVK